MPYDCSIVYSAKNLEDLETKVNSSLVGIHKWMTDHKLTINVQKSNYMLIDISGKNCNALKLHIGSNALKKVRETKILGIVFDDNLKFKAHIENICSSITSKIGVIGRLKQFLSMDVLNIIFKAIVQPKIDYGIAIYGHNFPTNINRIERLMNRACRVISSSQLPIEELYNRLKWKNFIHRRNYFSNIFIYRCIHKMSPELCNGLFKYRNITTRTRSSDNCDLLLPKKTTEIFGHSIFYSGVKIFNGLKKNQRTSQDFNSFIKYLRNNF